MYLHNSDSIPLHESYANDECMKTICWEYMHILCLSKKKENICIYFNGLGNTFQIMKLEYSMINEIKHFGFRLIYDWPFLDSINWTVTLRS